MNYDTSAIRQFILKTFDDEEFRHFCFDYFRDVAIDLTTGMRFRQMVQLLLEYCERHDQMDALVAALQRERTALFQQRFAPVPATTPPITPERNPRQIFISHATADAEIAHRLAADLEAEGWTIWIAPDSIKPGEKWVEAINRGLEASGVFVLLLTPEAVASRWVNSETNVAIEMEHEGLLKFIPLQIRPCGVPALWRAYQRIPFRGGYDTGWQALRHRLNPAAAPSPLPPIEMWPRQPEPPLPSPNPFIHEKSGLEFIRILAGDFLYGKEKETVYLPEYWISKTPVTQAQYQRFITANPEYDVPYYDADWAKPYNWDRENRTFPQDKADHPVVLVSWHDDVSFCEWAGLRLPTEEEWEKAARGTDGREYPWGNQWREKHCNSKEAGIRGTSRVGQFSPQGDSPYGCVDMSGNVWEWTDSWYDEKQSERGWRGGSWSLGQHYARAAFRLDSHPVFRDGDGGFRVVWVRRSPSQDH